jgi:hypothetical protein
LGLVRQGRLKATLNTQTPQTGTGYPQGWYSKIVRGRRLKASYLGLTPEAFRPPLRPVRLEARYLRLTREAFRLDSGMLVILLGGRTLAGVHWPPQMSLCREINPEGLQEYHYNRFAHVHMLLGSDPDRVTFSYTFPVDLDVTISPDNPVLRSMGSAISWRWAGPRAPSRGRDML